MVDCEKEAAANCNYMAMRIFTNQLYRLFGYSEDSYFNMYTTKHLYKRPGFFSFLSSIPKVSGWNVLSNTIIINCKSFKLLFLVLVITRLTVQVLDKTLKGIRAVWLDNRKVLRAPVPMTKLLEHLYKILNVFKIFLKEFVFKNL